MLKNESCSESVGRNPAWLPRIHAEIFDIVRAQQIGCPKGMTLPNSLAVDRIRRVLDALVATNVPPVGVRPDFNGGLFVYWIRSTSKGDESFADIVCFNDGLITANWTKDGATECWQCRPCRFDLENAAREMRGFMAGVGKIQ